MIWAVVEGGRGLLNVQSFPGLQKALQDAAVEEIRGRFLRTVGLGVCALALLVAGIIL
jgi:hypothetical protein